MSAVTGRQQLERRGLGLSKKKTEMDKVRGHQRSVSALMLHLDGTELLGEGHLVDLAVSSRQCTIKMMHFMADRRQGRFALLLHAYCSSRDHRTAAGRRRRGASLGQWRSVTLLISNSDGFQWVQPLPCIWHRGVWRISTKASEAIRRAAFAQTRHPYFLNA